MIGKERTSYRRMLREDASMLASGKHITRAAQKETEHVLAYRDPGGCLVHLEMEINSA